MSSLGCLRSGVALMSFSSSLFQLFFFPNSKEPPGFSAQRTLRAELKEPFSGLPSPRTEEGVFHGISCRHMLRLWDTWPATFDMGLSRLRCCIALDFICSFRANHGKKVFAEQLPRKPRGCSKLSGTQCLDSNWKYLKRFLPHTLSKKRSQVLLRESTFQWVWRYNNRTRTPADLLRCLARLFE